MFAVVRTGGKQYRVTAGDKIVVEKLSGNAGDKIDITDILLAGEGSDLKPVAGLTVAAEIVAQAKGEKVTVFKKRRRHNYRRKKGHRQLHTILRIVAIGDYKETKKAAPKAESKPAAASKADSKADSKPSARGKETAEVEAAQHQASEVVGTPTENPAPDNEKTAKGTEPAAKKPAAKKAQTPSTKNAAPAKAAAKKTPKAK